jgi:uncharacterized protein YndB with AHSA1/START domain
MTTIEFELERVIEAPVTDVFARLVAIEGYNAWMPQKGSMLHRTRQTSPGEPTVGTTYVDETSQGSIPGEIVECDAPRTVVFHWWQKSRSGKVRLEGWPGYVLEASRENATLVRHRAKLRAYGAYRLAAPILKRLVIRERTTTIDALKASFAGSGNRPTM